ncbi:MAG: DUF3105 domain-containing protein [Dehalococcoidia bacterium]|nr:DUF3105 domain-containing protein [Dehalococcoidia bacterium]MDD5494395.1 DUF3105 domain-containing protein [Dehalococcoidia bacterium]
MAGLAEPKWKSGQLQLIVGTILFLLVISAGSALACVSGQPSSQSQASIEDAKLPAHGDASLLTGVISPPDEGRDHIWPDHPVEYGTMPPTSGPHFPDPTAPGFYTTRPEFGYLVHSLEHGSVVIYYNPAQLSPDIEKSLRAFVKADSDPEVGVVAVPDADFKYPFILTAWDRMLTLDKYDNQVVAAFLAEYLGRGPESPGR